MLEVYMSGLRTVFRLDRDAWSIAQMTVPPPPPHAVECLYYVEGLSLMHPFFPCPCVHPWLR